jgi:general secretion pathway protein G
MSPSRRSRGVSFIEMMVVVAVLMILATAVVPVYRWDEKRRREERLRVSLETMRLAIDQYNKYMAEGLIQPQDVEQCAVAAALDTCWPLSLEELVEGVQVGDPLSPDLKTMRFLQRIPEDPFTGTAEWGMRSFQDDWDATSWGGENVYDVYSLSDLRALDGTNYSDW